MRPVVMAIAAWLVAGAAFAAPSPVSYQLSPKLEAGRLVALSVELRLTGDADGETVFGLPNGNSVAPGAAEEVRNLTVDGGALSTAGEGRLAVRHRPGAPLVLRYEVTGSQDDPPRQVMKPVIAADWFMIHGDRSLVAPAGREQSPVQVTWSHLPKGWIAASSLQTGAQPTVRIVNDSYLLGGAGWSRLKAGELTFFYRPAGWKISPPVDPATVARILAGDSAYWGDPPTPLFGAIMQTSGEIGGRGLPAGFILYAPAEADLRDYLRVVAHEHMHNWNSRKLGYQQDDDSREGWFKEGFTDALAARSLARSGVWTPAAFVDDFNIALKAYGLSPARTLTNAQISEQRRRGIDARQIPYNRGRLIAFLWDRRLRTISNGRLGLDDVLKAQRVSAAKDAAAGGKTTPDVLFPVVWRAVSGDDIEPQITTLVEEGRLIELSDDLFPGCGRFESHTQPVFARGFDLEATVAAGRVLTGLVPGGPAERAGLREGMRLRINEVHNNDSQIPRTYRVIQADGSMTPITYKPEGDTQIRFQQFRLAEGLDAAGLERCRRMFAGLQ